MAECCQTGGAEVEGMCCWLGVGDVDAGREPRQSAHGGGGRGPRGC